MKPKTITKPDEVAKATIPYYESVCEKMFMKCIKLVSFFYPKKK